MQADHNTETSLLCRAWQAVSSPVLECQCDAHWGELDWKINDSGRSQKDLAGNERALHSVTHTEQRANNSHQERLFFSSGLNRIVNRAADGPFLKKLNCDLKVQRNILYSS